MSSFYGNSGGGDNKSSSINIDNTLTKAGQAADAYAAGHIVIVSETEPEDISNKIWIKDESVNEILVPTMDEFNEFKNKYGSPLTASTVSAMTDNTRVYVYTGSETGYINGNWYYYDGSAWVSGGVYNSIAINTDDTLTEAGTAADAKKTGDEITALKDDLTEAVNYNLDILIECLRNIVWLNPSAEDLIDQFKYVEDTPEVVSLSAYITSLDSSIVVGGDLDSLRPYLSVKATYDDETSAQVTGYTLSGSLVTGINTITVSYGGKNTQVYLYLPIGNPDHILYELPQNTRTNYTRINSGIQLDATDSDYTVLGIVEDISVFGESTSQHRIVDGSMNPSGISYAKGTNVYVNPSNGNKKYVIMCDAKAITSSEYSDQSHTLKFVARRTFSGANATITVSLFVDGTKIQTRNESRNTAYNGTTHSKPIGVGGTLAISDGSIYNVTDASFSLFRIYDRALTDSEINTILGVTI